MSIDAWAWEQKLPFAEKFVLVTLAHLSGCDGACELSQAAIAEVCGFSRATVNRLLGRLIERKLLTSTPRVREDGGTLPCRYTPTCVL
jgi:CRP-like cAMP-binding protein